MGWISHLSFLNIQKKLRIFALMSSVSMTFTGWSTEINTVKKTLTDTTSEDYYQVYRQKIRETNRVFLDEQLKNKKTLSNLALLGLFEFSLKSAEISKGHEIFILIKKRVLSKDDNFIFDLLRSDFELQTKDFASAYLHLKKYAYDSNNRYFSYISTLYVKSLIDLKLKAEVLSYYKDYHKYIEEILSWEEEHDLLVKVAESAYSLGLYNQALFYLKNPLLYYPINPSGRDAMILLSKIECAGSSTGPLFHTTENRSILTKEMFKRIGKNEQARNLVLALVNIDIENPIPKQNVDELDFNQKQSLVEQIQLLISAREYSIAFKISDYLSKSIKYNDIFKREIILDLQGRILNALNQPKLAIQNYQEITTKYSNTNLFNVINDKLAFSYHYAREYKVASDFAEKYSVFSNPVDRDWFIFWQKYLDNQNIITASNNSDHFIEKKKFYWENIYKIKNNINKKESEQNLYKLSNNDQFYPYSIFASLHLKMSDQENILTNIKTTSYNFNFKKIKNKFKNKTKNKKEIYRIESLLKNNLILFAIYDVKSLNKSSISLEDSLVISKLLYKHNLYKIANDILKNHASSILNETRQAFFQFPVAYWDKISLASSSVEIDPFWVLSIIKAESAFNAQAESSVGAVGLMQIMPYTGYQIANRLHKEAFTTAALRNPSESIAFGTWYLNLLYRYYDKNIVLATAAYNAGPDAVNRWISQNTSLTIDEFYENIPFQETKKYVARVLGFLDSYYRIYSASKKGYQLQISLKLPEIKLNESIF